MANTPIQVGIIGLGRSGWDLHAATIEPHPNFQVAAVTDPQEERRNEAVARFNCVAHASPSELIADPNVELVVVATPSHTHAALACEALNAGKHVLCRKPIASTLAEADAMVEAARQSGKILTAYHVLRAASDFLKIREIVNSGVLGPIHLIKVSVYSYNRRRDWQTLRKFSGGMLNNVGPHHIDQAMVLAGGEWSDVYADMRHLISGGDADDHTKVLFRGKNGALVDVEITSVAAAPAKPPHWTILGKYGALTGSASQIDWKYYDPATVPAVKASEETPQREYDKPEELPWTEFSEEVGIGDPQPAFYDQLYSAIREGDAPPATPEELRNLIALFDACRSQSGMN